MLLATSMDRQSWPFAMLLAVILLPACELLADSSPGDLANRVDRLLVEEVFSVAQGQFKLAPRCDDPTYLRRIFLDLVGTVPTPKEVMDFSLDRDPKKRQKKVERLLSDPRFATNWASYWRDVIMYRRTEQRAIRFATILEAFLTEQILAKAPWDNIASSFVTALGDVNQKGETALILAQGGKPEETVGEISRIFMGIQIQCAQCHDHPTDRWKREQFHELAAFFPRVAIRPVRSADERSFKIVSDDRAVKKKRNNDNRNRGTFEHKMPNLEDPSLPGTLMKPALYVTGQELKTGIEDIKRREALALWMTSPENPWFAKAYVNRMWSELVGEGFYEPVDDMGPDRQCLAPKTMSYLATGFQKQAYDMRWLIRTIMATNAYQRESRPRRKVGEVPFTANCTQRLRADQLFNVMHTALGGEIRQRPSGPAQQSKRGNSRENFNEIFGYDPSSPRDEVKESMSQALALMNSSVVQRSINSRRRTGLGKWLNEIKVNDRLVVELYLRCLTREPSDHELKTCLEYVQQTGRRDVAYEDILWSLVNSTEFLQRK